MEIKVIKDGTTEEMVYNDLELLEEIASKLIEKKDNAVTLETLQQDNELLLTFVKTYLAADATLKDIAVSYTHLTLPTKA